MEVSRISASSLLSCALLFCSQRRPPYLRPNFLVRLQCNLRTAWLSLLAFYELIDSEKVRDVPTTGNGKMKNGNKT